jgi:thiol-disulfide isomerase/thioredoxin
VGVKRVTRGRRAAVLGLAVAVLTALVAGCSADKDAVVQGSQYSFVSPGGKTELFYPADQRKPLPPLSGESLTDAGKQISLSDYPDKVIVLNIWGSWCAPCRNEAPEMQQVADQTKNSGVQFLGIDIKDERSSAQDFVQNNNISYPSIYDFAGRSLLSLGGFPRSAVPATIVLDRQHRVAAVYLQQLLAAQLLPEVQQIAADKS